MQGDGGESRGLPQGARCSWAMRTTVDGRSAFCFPLSGSAPSAAASGQAPGAAVDGARVRC